MLRDLHIQLHLPQTIGLVLVSAVGAMLVGLIVSGLFAHPRIFRDAFKLRLGGSRRLEQADIHNRLSVWGLPFHLMISVTGAFYGLVGLLAIVAAAAWYGGDRDSLFDAIYGADPVLQHQAGSPNASRAMTTLRSLHPQVIPLYLVVHEVGTEQQFMEVAATVPGRLAYSEIYRFDSSGEYLGSQELTSGPVGKQFLYSLYRIHFGYFGGQWTRILWCLLGLALTVVSVSGVNVWLEKRNRNDHLSRAWLGFVWGMPLGLTLSAIASIFLSLSPLPVLVVSVAGCVIACVRSKRSSLIKAVLFAAIGIALLALAICHWLVFNPHDYGYYLMWVNSGLMLVGAWAIAKGCRATFFKNRLNTRLEAL